MKKFTLFVLLICILGLSVKAQDNDLVKVYVFVSKNGFYSDLSEEAIKSLKGLESYGKKFEIIEKEAYVYSSKFGDAEDGKDLELFKKVIAVYNEAGFDYTYTQTPTAIVSDEFIPGVDLDFVDKVVNDAYENGDKDLVGCIDRGENDCSVQEKETNNTKADILKKILIFIVIFFILMACFIIYFILDGKKIKRYDLKR